jgi:uncharacterized protein (TIRG00374 family)
MRRKFRKYAVYLLIISAVLVVLIVLVFFTYGFDMLMSLLRDIRYGWIVTAFACMVVFWLGDAGVLHMIVRRLFKGQSFLNSVKVSMAGVFFNAITPFASGGQPVQVYIMARGGMKPGIAASIVMIKSVTYQGMLVLHSMALIMLKGSFIISRIPGFFYLYILGFLLNLFVVGLYVLFIYSNKTAGKIVMFLFNIAQRAGMKRLAKHREKLEYELAAFERGARLLKNNAYLIYNTCLMQLLRLSVFYLIPYFIMLGVKPSPVNIWDMVAAQSIITVISSFVPSPGAAGGAEGTGYIFFKIFFGTGMIIPILLIWRIITYYSSVVFGGIVSLLAPEKPIRETG